MGSSLYPLFDLCGSTAGISWKHPDPHKVLKDEKVQRGKATKLPMSGFHPSQCGSSITLEANRTKARRAEQATSECVLFGDNPLEPNKSGDVSYMLSVHSVQRAAEHGIFVGVTCTVPENMAFAPSTADAVELSWLVGFDGSYFDGETSAWGLSP